MNKPAIVVDKLSFALGEDCRDLAETDKEGRLVSDKESLLASGFARHHICRTGQSAYDLAKRAVQLIVDENGAGNILSDVDLIIYATCIPLNGNIGNVQLFAESKDVKYLMDFPASHLQADFDMARASVLGINQQACTSMLGSLRLAAMHLQCEPLANKVLCLTADRFPEGAVYEQSYNLISDGAAACLVSRADDNDGSGFNYVAAHGITNGALAMASDDETVGSFFNYSHRLIQELLAKAQLKIDDLAWIVPQNTNRKAWQVLSSLLRFDFARVYFPTLAEVGHVISGDNIINLSHLQKQGALKKGDRILCFMAGYGLNWQCVLLEKR